MITGVAKVEQLDRDRILKTLDEARIDRRAVKASKEYLGGATHARTIRECESIRDLHTAVLMRRNHDQYRCVGIAGAIAILACDGVSHGNSESGGGLETYLAIRIVKRS